MAFPYLLALASPQAAQATQAEMPPHTTTLQLSITGMTCEGCAATVQQTLVNNIGVIDATVSYGDKTATIRYDSTAYATRCGGTLSALAMSPIVRSAGD